jgi:hypothetical protein
MCHVLCSEPVLAVSVFGGAGCNRVLLTYVVPSNQCPRGLFHIDSISFTLRKVCCNRIGPVERWKTEVIFTVIKTEAMDTMSSGLTVVGLRAVVLRRWVHVYESHFYLVFVAVFFKIFSENGKRKSS